MTRWNEKHKQADDDSGSSKASRQAYARAQRERRAAEKVKISKEKRGEKNGKH